MLSIAVLAVSLAVPPAQAADPPKKDMVCGAVTAEDVQEVFNVVLYYSGYDNTLEDQKSWGKPRRAPTTGLFMSDDRSFKAFGSPAVAFAANTGINKDGALAKASHVYMHLPSLCDITQNRGELAFILAHEMSHLVLHHPEQLEKNNMDTLLKWCESHDCDRDAKVVVKEWEKDTRAQREAFQRKQEQEADREARQWITTLNDPVTGKTFAAEAGEESLKSAQEWLNARGEKLDDPTHGTLASRVEVMRKDRELMARPRTAGLQDKAKAIEAKIGKGF